MKNKIKIGDKVRAKKSMIDWHTSHLSWSFGNNPNDSAYSKDEKEIGEESFKDVYFFLHCKLSGEMPYGVAGHYGERDYKGAALNVWVDFFIKTEIGLLTYGTYCEEKSLVRIVKRKKKCRKSKT